MKFIFVVLSLTFNFALFAQSETYVGNCEAHFKAYNQGEMDYILSLNADGTFSFHFHRNVGPSNPEENQYGKGTWTFDKNLVFDGSKARIICKSPTNISLNEIKEVLLFYESRIFWVERMKLLKIDV